MSSPQVRHKISFHLFIMIHVGTVLSLRWGSGWFQSLAGVKCQTFYRLQTVIVGHTLWENYRWLSTVLSVAPETASVEGLKIKTYCMYIQYRHTHTYLLFGHNTLQLVGNVACYWKSCSILKRSVCSSLLTSTGTVQKSGAQWQITDINVHYISCLQFSADEGENVDIMRMMIDLKIIMKDWNV